MTRSQSKQRKRNSQLNGLVRRSQFVDVVKNRDGRDESPMPLYYVEVPIPPSPVVVFKSLLGASFIVDQIKWAWDLLAMEIAILERGGHIIRRGEALPDNVPIFYICCDTTSLLSRSERLPQYRKVLTEKGLSDLIIKADRQIRKTLARMPISSKRNCTVRMTRSPFATNQGGCQESSEDSGEALQIVFQTIHGAPRPKVVAKADTAGGAAAPLEDEERTEKAMLRADTAVPMLQSPAQVAHDPEEWIMNQGL